MATSNQLQSIQAMLTAGQRCVHLDRHSLLLWGFIGGGLCGFTDQVLTPERFPDLTQRAVALLLWLGFWFGLMATVDYVLTHRLRSAREETLPFAQQQITRAWWMLLAVGILCSFAMFFHGGGAMIYALWAVLLGLGMFFFGLFSRPLIEWIGLATILIGAGALAAGVPMLCAQWLTASCFAIGLPLAGCLVSRVDDRSVPKRVAALVFWLVAVVGAGMGVARLSPGMEEPVADAPQMTFEPGVAVPLRVEMEGSLVSVAPDITLPVVVRRKVQVALKDGQPDGRYRIEDQAWSQVRDGALYLRIDRIQPQFGRSGAEIVVHGNFTFAGDKQ